MKLSLEAVASLGILSTVQRSIAQLQHQEMILRAVLARASLLILVWGSSRRSKVLGRAQEDLIVR